MFAEISIILEIIADFTEISIILEIIDMTNVCFPRDDHPETILSLDRIMTEPGNGIRHVNLIDQLLNV